MPDIGRIRGHRSVSNPIRESQNLSIHMETIMLHQVSNPIRESQNFIKFCYFFVQVQVSNPIRESQNEIEFFSRLKKYISFKPYKGKSKSAPVPVPAVEEKAFQTL